MPTKITSSALIPEQPQKLFYIDRLRVILTVLVILHHSFITYGSPGGWYYAQKTTKIGALIPMTMFVAINQAFFMGFFFLLSACFISPSYNKKGAFKFLVDRLKRLGIPLIFYSFILSPVLSYLVYYWGYGHHISYPQYLGGFDGWIDFGVLWFVAALLLFTVIYLIVRYWFKTDPVKAVAAPSEITIVLFAVVIGVISFLVRIIFPVGWVLKPVGFQLGHFTQYITLFVLGLLAYQSNWLNTITIRTGKRLSVLVIIMILCFPVFYVIKAKTDMQLEWYSGGLHWQSLLYAVWEQIIGFSIIVTLLTFGRNLWNLPSTLWVKLSRYTFAVYIFHPLILISISLAVRNWEVDPSIKLLVVAPLAVAGSFLLAAVITRIPGVKRII